MQTRPERIADALSSIAESLRIIALSFGNLGISGRLGDVTTSQLAAARADVRQDVTIDEALARWRDELTSRGCRGSSVARFTQLVERAARSQGWQSTRDLAYLSAVAWLAANKRGDHGKPWADPTYNQAVTVLRTFGEFCRRAGFAPENPMEDLQSVKQAQPDGCRSLTVEEARRLVASALHRQNDARAHGFAALFWHCLLCTGLRYTELASLTWSAVNLDGQFPGIRLPRRLAGNKAKRADFLPLPPESVHLLKRWQQAVPAGHNQRVFEIVPNRQTWRMDRDDAGIAPTDHRGRKTSIHSTRKTYCTIIDGMGHPAGLVARLARHATTLTERVYIDHDEGELWKAVQTYPLLWPSGCEDFSTFVRKTSPDSSSGLAGPMGLGYLGSASQDEYANPPDNSADSSDGLPPGHARGSHLDSPGRSSLRSAHWEGGRIEIEVGFGLSPTTPITNLQARDRLTDEVDLVLTRWLKSRLDRPSGRDGDGGRGNQQNK